MVLYRTRFYDVCFLLGAIKITDYYSLSLKEDRKKVCNVSHFLLCLLLIWETCIDQSQKLVVSSRNDLREQLKGTRIKKQC